MKSIIPNGTEVFVAFMNEKCPWANYVGKAIIVEYSEDEVWTGEGGEPYYKVTIDDCEAWFPVSSIHIV